MIYCKGANHKKNVLQHSRVKQMLFKGNVEFTEL